MPVGSDEGKGETEQATGSGRGDMTMDCRQRSREGSDAAGDRHRQCVGEDAVQALPWLAGRGQGKDEFKQWRQGRCASVQVLGHGHG